MRSGITQGSSVVAQDTFGPFLIDRWASPNPAYSAYPCFDWLGSERVVMDYMGHTVNGTISYDAFGQMVATSGSSRNPYMFGATSGYRTDGDAGLMQVGARYYDAQVGRFITRDTELDEHPYVYCDHDPVNCVDPSGHEPTIGGAIAEFVIATAIDVGGEIGFGGSLGGMEGAGSAFGPAVTILDSMTTAGEGIVTVVKYRLKIQDYLNEDGQWNP